jgi:hypothetical protein
VQHPRGPGDRRRLRANSNSSMAIADSSRVSGVQWRRP